MPLDVSPTTIVLDKTRIEQFTVSPQIKTIVIKYSKGYNDVNGEYVPKEYSYVNFENIEFDQNLYSLTKDILYDMLKSHLNNA